MEKTAWLKLYKWAQAAIRGVSRQLAAKATDGDVDAATSASIWCTETPNNKIKKNPQRLTSEVCLFVSERQRTFNF